MISWFSTTWIASIPLHFCNPATKSMDMSRHSFTGMSNAGRTSKLKFHEVQIQWQSWRFCAYLSTSYLITFLLYRQSGRSNIFAHPECLAVAVSWQFHIHCNHASSLSTTCSFPWYHNCPVSFVYSATVISFQMPLAWISLIFLSGIWSASKQIVNQLMALFRQTILQQMRLCWSDLPL